jgi:hypothetical protein
MSPATPDQERDNSPTPVPGDKGKKRQTSPEWDVQEYEEQQAKEQQEAEERAAAMEADLMPHERARLVAANRETARRMQELAAEWTRDIEEAQKNVERVEELRARKSQRVLPRPMIWSKRPISFAAEFHQTMIIFRMLRATPRMRARRRRRKRRWG